MILEAPFRQARSEDAPRMAELVNIAGDGLPLYLWRKFARDGQTGWDVGLERASNGIGGFAYHNTVVRDVDGQAAACLIGYASNGPPPPVGDPPAPLKPLMELSEIVHDTWYLNVLATHPEYRGRGFASALLRIADELARASGKERISLIMSDANEGARRLYTRNGYAECATRPMVKESWEHVGQNWVLLVKAL
ncbi:MAG: GNAT family N-acetyltransferase [Phycisphaerales bacterium]|nr:GNAT family N-acetyltransferase [Phycisphaerales bacterium]